MLHNSDEEGVYRRDLVARGKEAGHAENTLDGARKELVETGETLEKPEGNQVRIYPASPPPPVPLSLREEEEKRSPKRGPQTHAPGDDSAPAVENLEEVEFT